MTNNMKEKIIKIIANSESVDKLPLYKDFKKILNKKEMEYLKKEFLISDYIDRVYMSTRLKIKDGTIICLQRHFDFADCINDNHNDFYYIEKTDTYICLDCGTKQKAYDFFTTREYLDTPIRGERMISIHHYTMIPLGWNKQKINKYLEDKKKRKIRINNIINEKERRRKEAIRRYNERLLKLLDDKLLLNNKYKELIDSIDNNIPDEFKWKMLDRDIDTINSLLPIDLMVDVEEIENILKKITLYRYIKIKNSDKETHIDEIVTTKYVLSIYDNEYKMYEILIKTLNKYKVLDIKQMACIAYLCYAEEYSYNHKKDIYFKSDIKKIKEDLITPYFSEQEYENIKSKTIYLKKY